MKRLLITLAIFSLYFINTYAKEIILVSDPYPPYVLDEKDNKGYVMDIAKIAYKAMGYKAIYKNIPFKRALKDVENCKYDGILAIRKEGRENFIYPKTTLGLFNNKFFRKKGTNWVWKGNIRSLENITLGWINGYQIGGDFFLKYIEKNKNNSNRIQFTSGSNALLNNIRKLAKGRIDILLDDEKVILYTAKKNGFSLEIEDAGIFKPDNAKEEWVSIGFSDRNPNASELAEIFDMGFKKIRNSKELKNIFAKYGLKPF